MEVVTSDIDTVGEVDVIPIMPARLHAIAPYSLNCVPHWYSRVIQHCTASLAPQVRPLLHGRANGGV